MCICEMNVLLLYDMICMQLVEIRTEEDIHKTVGVQANVYKIIIIQKQLIFYCLPETERKREGAGSERNSCFCLPFVR